MDGQTTTGDRCGCVYVATLDPTREPWIGPWDQPREVLFWKNRRTDGGFDLVCVWGEAGPFQLIPVSLGLRDHRGGGQMTRCGPGPPRASCLWRWISSGAVFLDSG